MEAMVAYIAARELRRARNYKDPLDPLNIDDKDLLHKYRFPRHEIIKLCEELEPHVGRPTKRSRAIPTHAQVLATLQFLASGIYQSVIADTTGLTQASVSRVIEKMTDVLYNKAIKEVKMPTSMCDINTTAKDFYRISGFPRVIGAVDGTDIPITVPKADGHIYVNNKGYHSLNLQIVANADHLITSYSVKYPGSTEDAYIWSNCPLRARFQAGVYRDTHLLGDSGYPLEANLLTPYPNPMTHGQENYNRSHAMTRAVIDQSLRILKSRFQCLHNSGRPLKYEPKKCAKIAAACILLHNRCIELRIPAPELLEEENEEDPPAIPGLPETTEGQEIRDEVVENFFT